MTIEFDIDELRELVKDSYELMMSIPSPRSPNYEIGSRSKLKNLPEALHEFEDAHSSVTHFIKSAAYFLPRSDNELSDFLDVLLTKVKKIQASENDPEKIREKIRYLIGYSNWSMDAVCNIFKISNNDDVKTKNRLKTMISTEFKILGAEDDVDYLVTKIMHWKASGHRGR